MTLQCKKIFKSGGQIKSCMGSKNGFKESEIITFLTPGSRSDENKKIAGMPLFTEDQLH